jgi:hypothetical protein
MKTIKEAALEYAEKHGFRVPYDGSNEFYDKTDVKASEDGFLAGVEFAQRWISVDEELPMKRYGSSSTIILIKTSANYIYVGIYDHSEETWVLETSCLVKGGVTHWLPIKLTHIASKPVSTA